MAVLTRSRPRRRRGVGTGARAVLLGFGLGVAALPGAARAQTLLTQEEALRRAFPQADAIERRTAYLDSAQLARAEAAAGPDAKAPAAVVTYYVGVRDGAPIGAAYFDVHRVRTLPEVLMVVVDTGGGVRRVEIVRFSEPPEYRAPRGWLRQFVGRVLGRELSLKGDIVGITGATLTSDAATRAVRRVLALHAVIDPFDTEAGR